MTSSLGAGVDPETIGRQLHECIADLYPICRSITGEGVRETLRRLQRVTPITVREVPSGSAAFDWTVPLEWNVRDAFVKNSKGERVIDFRRSNLHVVSSSVPVHRRMRLAELKPHLFTLPDQPRSIPYRTSYYEKSWGFCLSRTSSRLSATTNMRSASIPRSSPAR
jgi:aminopeptidase-like protein